MASDAEWRDVLLEELAASTKNALVGGPFGSDLVSSDYSPTGVPVIRGENLATGRWVAGDFVFVLPAKAQKLSANTAGPLDIVFTQRGANHYRQVAVVPADADGRFVISQSQMKLTVDRLKVDPLFTYYLFRSPIQQEYLQRNAIQTGVPHTNLAILRTVPLRIPSLPTQCAITHILGTLDDKIELNRRMNETLEAMARALFKSWFVDFDPVRAKAEGRDPGLPKPLADLFPDSFEDSELGEIPKGWAVKKLSDLCSTQYGYTASAVDKPVGPKFLRVTDINKRNWIEWGDVPHCAIEPDARASYALQVGDLVVARMADPGKSAIIEEEIDAVFASYLVRLKTPSHGHSYYVYGFLKSDVYAEYAEGAKSGSVQSNMNAKVIVGASLVVPTNAAIEQFLRAVLSLRQRLVANVRESRTLAALRDALLPKLISGELRVRDAEQTAEIA